MFEQALPIAVPIFAALKFVSPPPLADSKGLWGGGGVLKIEPTGLGHKETSFCFSSRLAPTPRKPNIFPKSGVSPFDLTG